MLNLYVQTRYGFQRTVCGCDDCSRFCSYMPGMLCPEDLEVLYGRYCGENPQPLDIYAWAEQNLRASPGAVVMRGGEVFRIPTIVPALVDGKCVNLQPDGRCGVHSSAPYGCSFFDSHMSRANGDGRSAACLTQIHAEFRKPDSLYAKVWDHLSNGGLTSRPPEKLREALKREYAAQQTDNSSSPG